MSNEVIEEKTKKRSLPKWLIIIIVIILLSIIFIIFGGKSLFELTCEDGAVLVGDECISCPQGYIMNLEDKTCTMSEEKIISEMKSYFKSINGSKYELDVTKNDNNEYELTVHYEKNIVYLHIFGEDVIYFTKNMLNNSNDLTKLISTIHYIATENGTKKYYIDVNNYQSISLSNIDDNLVIKDSNQSQINKSVDQIKKDYINEYKQLCKTYDYKTIFRYSEEYKGKDVKYTGKVVQVIEGSISNSYRVNVTKDKWGYYDDTIYVTFIDLDGSTPRILEDDIITFYGTLSDLYTYETVLGASVTIPSVTATYIDIN